MAATRWAFVSTLRFAVVIMEGDSLLRMPAELLSEREADAFVRTFNATNPDGRFVARKIDQPVSRAILIASSASEAA